MITTIAHCSPQAASTSTASSVMMAMIALPTAARTRPGLGSIMPSTARTRIEAESKLQSKIHEGRRLPASHVEPP